MVNHACAFNQSGSKKYFEWIIISLAYVSSETYNLQRVFLSFFFLFNLLFELNLHHTKRIHITTWRNKHKNSWGYIYAWIRLASYNKRKGQICLKPIKDVTNENFTDGAHDKRKKKKKPIAATSTNGHYTTTERA